MFLKRIDCSWLSEEKLLPPKVVFMQMEYHVNTKAGVNSQHFECTKESAIVEKVAVYLLNAQGKSPIHCMVKAEKELL